MMNETWKLHFYLPMTISVVCLCWLTVKFAVQEIKENKDRDSNGDLEGEVYIYKEFFKKIHVYSNIYIYT